MFYIKEFQSPIGVIALACDKEGEKLTGLWLEGQKYHGGKSTGATLAHKEMPALSAAETWLNQYFAGEKPALAKMPLAPEGSDFRRTVWRVLCEIPYGAVVTYGTIAKKVAARLSKKQMSSQAVGGAVGHNPISIIIPCHRVIGANGNLTGYAGGIETKARLLALEGVDLSQLFAPDKRAF